VTGVGVPATGTKPGGAGGEGGEATIADPAVSAAATGTAATCLNTNPRGQRHTPTSNQATRRRLIELEPLLTRRHGGRFGRRHIRCHHRGSGPGPSN
jgi:hypothetical protein